jgi:TolB protein
MAEVRRDGEQAPVLTPGPTLEPSGDGAGGGQRTRLWVTLGLALVAVVVVVAGVLWTGLPGREGDASGSVAPSAAVVVPSPVAVTPSAAPVAPSASPRPASPAVPSATPSPPTAPTSPGLIAVVGDDGSLSTMDDGGGSRVLYPAPGVALGFPAWSPDGSQIAVMGAATNGTGIYVFDVPRAAAAAPGVASSAKPIIGPDPVVIYRSQARPPFYLYWTPDGQQVAFLASESVGLSLRIAPADGSAPLDGSGPASLIRQGAPLYFDWIDAGRLLVHVNVGSEAFTGEVGLDGASVKPAVKGTGLFRSASISGDRRYLAYVRSESDGSEKLVVAARDGSTSHEVAVFGPAAFIFDPTGDGLASIASSEPVAPDSTLPFGPLKLTDPGTGKVRTLLEGPVVAFFWSPDGRTIAAILPSRPGDDPASPGTDTGTQAPGVTARLAMVDVSTGAVRSERVVQLGVPFVNQLLPYFDQYALSHQLWSPDSASILLPLVDAAGQGQVVVVSAGDSEPRPVTGGAEGFWSP